MFGSDMALFSLNRPNEIVDAHVVETPFPKEDDCQRDWIYVMREVAIDARFKKYVVLKDISFRIDLE